MRRALLLRNSRTVVFDQALARRLLCANASVAATDGQTLAPDEEQYQHGSIIALLLPVCASARAWSPLVYTWQGQSGHDRHNTAPGARPLRQWAPEMTERFTLRS